MTAFFRWFMDHPRTLLLFFSLLVIWRVLALGHLTYGDIPYFDVATSRVNYLYSWGSEQLGTPVRQSLNTLRDAFLLLVSPVSIIYYLLKYVMPLVLIPQLYFWIFSRLGLRSKAVLLVGSLFPLFTPIVFGDFLTGQTFWVYLTIPMVLFYTIKIFALKQFTLRNDVLLGVWMFLSLGMLPPVIVPLAAAVAVFALTMLMAQTAGEDTRRTIVLFLVSGLRSVIIFALLALPYMLIASSGQDAYTSPSLLGDYYHNYAETHLLNTLRMAGNNGSGQSTLGYNDWSLTNIVGYGIAAVMIGGGVVLGLRQKMSRYWVVITGLLAVLLALLGFMQLLTINTVLGARVFESQWLVSTVRNPSKLYTILLPIFTLLFTFGLGNILQKYGRTKRAKYGILAGAVVMMAVYGWPALRGDLGLLAGREDSAQTYKQDPLVRAIAKSPEAQKGRALLLPADHRDELNYEFLNPNFNLLRLEGSLPGSSRTMDALGDALNERNPYFFRYLSALGVKTVFVKKDQKSYEQVMFGLFPVRLTPEQTRTFLDSGLDLANETDNVWEFHNPDASDPVYSPEELTYIKDAKSDENMVPFYAKNQAVVGQVESGQADRATVFQSRDTLGQSQTISTGRAQLYDPSLLIADMYRDTMANEAVFEIINPVMGGVERSVRVPLNADETVVRLGESRYIVTPQKQRVSLRAADYQALVSRLELVELTGQDASFESTSWQAGDATPRDGGEAMIRTTSVTDTTNGTRSLELGSEAHKAFVSTPLPRLDSNYEYVLQFDYKNISGASPSFAIYQGKQNILPAEGGLADDDAWRTQTVFFSPPEDNQDIAEFFYYSDGSPGNPSVNRIDNVRLYQVRDGRVTPLSVASYSPDYELKDYRPPNLLNQSQGQNLLTNGTFEDPSLWGTVGDATSSAKGKADVQMSRSSDHAAGDYALELKSHNHTAYVSRRMTRFVPNAVYKLSFDYKHVRGRLPSFAIWQDGASVARPALELEAGDGWTHYETYFVPDIEATNMTMYLYARSTGELTVNLYDNVKLETTSLVSSYLDQSSEPKLPTEQIVESYKRINPTTIQVTMRPGAGMLVFNESFHKGWRAYLESDGTEITAHQVVNGFANGWWVDSSKFSSPIDGSYQITLRYEPQQSLYVGLAVMGSTALVVTIYLAWSIWRERRNEP